MKRDGNRIRKGRGALSNQEGRFESYRTEAFDDGWYMQDPQDVPPLTTHLREDSARTIITRNQSPDVPFDRSVNPYRGCEHGCVYCFARPTHAYLGLSPGLDFETEIFRKKDAALLLEEALRKPSYRCKTLVLGANTDIYQPVERGQKLTRSILEVLLRFSHPVAMITKSALILRDLDLLQEFAARNLVKILISITTLDPELARLMEPRAAAPSRRLETVRQLALAGVPTAVSVAPVIPALNDWELERILAQSVRAGASSAAYILLRLPHEVRGIFKEWLFCHFPDRAEHVMSLIRQMREGRENQSQFGKRMRGSGPYADMLRQRYRLACRKLGLSGRSFELRTDLFHAPPQEGDQLSLF